VRISPLQLTGSAEGWKQPLVAVFICDPQQNGVTTDETLHRLYGLTRAEAHLALLLAQGTRLVEASKILGITPETARTHVKRIFSKTDTGGQVELVHLLLSHMAISTDEYTR
jgi:DNA-binding CsgD family transcriptional regulator